MSAANEVVVHPLVRLPRYHDMIAAGVEGKQAMAWHEAILCIESCAVNMAEGIEQGADDLSQRAVRFRSAHGPVKANGEEKNAPSFCTLDALVRSPNLQDLTVCRMAQRDLDKGDIESALARLRVDADKIRPTCRELYDIINANAGSHRQEEAE